MYMYIHIKYPSSEERCVYLTGDSRAFILHKDGTYTIMSKDHKPNDPEEVARITRAGGFVSRVRKVYRVDGSLSLSRAFGDIVRALKWKLF